MKTLFPRMRQISATAQQLSEHFAGHPGISRVAYDLVEGPGTGSGPDRQDDALGEDRK